MVMSILYVVLWGEGTETLAYTCNMLGPSQRMEPPKNKKCFGQKKVFF